MIAHLKGVLVATGIDHAVIDVGGVGYLVGASAKTLAAIGPVGVSGTANAMDSGSVAVRAPMDPSQRVSWLSTIV